MVEVIVEASDRHENGLIRAPLGHFPVTPIM